MQANESFDNRKKDFQSEQYFDLESLKVHEDIKYSDYLRQASLSHCHKSLVSFLIAHPHCPRNIHMKTCPETIHQNLIFAA